jgi:hypothetical protein
MQAVKAEDIWQSGFGRAEPAPPERVGWLRRLGRGVATFVLGGLTTMELIAVAVGYIAVVGFLWMADVVQPERLVTDPWSRGAWLVVVVSLLRPVTWVPYWLCFTGFRWLVDSLFRRKRAWVRNLLANVGTLGVLAGIVAVVVSQVARAGTFVLSALAFVTGSGRFQDVGLVRGDWTGWRIAGVVGGFLLLKLFLPPLDRSLDLSHEPILGFASGGRGRFDRYLLLGVVVAGAALAGVGAFLLSRG